MEKEIKLKVNEAMQDDVGRGVVRIDSILMRQADIAQKQSPVRQGRRRFMPKVLAEVPDRGTDTSRVGGVGDG